MSTGTMSVARCLFGVASWSCGKLELLRDRRRAWKERQDYVHMRECIAHSLATAHGFSLNLFQTGSLSNVAIECDSHFIYNPLKGLHLPLVRISSGHCLHKRLQ